MVSSSGSSNGSSTGFAYMGLVFKIRDDSSRGHVRKYALIALAEKDQELMRDWTFLVNHFNRIRTWMVKSPETAAARNASAAAGIGNSGGDSATGAAFTTSLASDHAATAAYASPPSLFLRNKRDASSTQSQTLPELLKNAAFFQELHGKFTAILVTLDKKYNQALASF